MTARFRLPSRDAVPHQSAPVAAADIPPLLRRLVLGTPFPLGTPVLYPRGDPDRCVYASSLEAAAIAALSWPDNGDAKQKRSASQTRNSCDDDACAIGYAVGTLPTLVSSDDARSAVVIATSWRARCGLDAHNMAPPSAVDRADHARDFVVVPPRAVHALGTLSARLLRQDSGALETGLPSAQCVLGCVAAEAGSAGNQSALLHLLVHEYVSRTPVPPSSFALYRAEGRGRAAQSPTCLRLVTVATPTMITPAEGETRSAGARSSASSSSPPPHNETVVVVCADVCAGAATVGLAHLQEAIASSDSWCDRGWTRLEACVRGLASSSRAVTAVEVAVTVTPRRQADAGSPPTTHLSPPVDEDDANDSPAIQAVSLKVHVDGSRARHDDDSTQTNDARGVTDGEDAVGADNDLMASSWRQYFASLDDVFLFARHGSRAHSFDRFCAHAATSATTPEALREAFSTAVTAAAASAAQAEDRASPSPEHLSDTIAQAVGAHLWDAGVAALESELNSHWDSACTSVLSSPPSPCTRTCTLLLLSTPDDVVDGVLPSLARQDQRALVADSAVEGTGRAWHAVLAACDSAGTVTTRGSALSSSVAAPRARALRRRHPIATWQRGAAADTVLESLVRARPRLLRDSVITSLTSRGFTDKSAHRNTQTESEMTLSGDVDVVYYLEDPPAGLDANAMPVVQDLLDGLARLYSTYPTEVFTFSHLATAYLYEAVYGASLCPKALSNGGDGATQLHRQMQALREGGRHRDACLLCFEKLPCCRTQPIVGASYVVVDQHTLAQLRAFRFAAQSACAAVWQRVGRGLHARREMAQRRVANATRQGESLWRTLGTPSTTYWTALEAQRSSLLRPTESAPWSREPLRARACDVHGAWTDVRRDHWRASLAIVQRECATLSTAVSETIAAWQESLARARAPIKERLQAYEVAWHETTRQDRARQTHRAAVRQLLAHEAHHTRAVEEKQQQQAEHAHAVRQATRQDALRREARREIETARVRQRGLTDLHHETGVIQQHIARQEMRFRSEGSRLSQRRHTAAVLQIHDDTDVTRAPAEHVVAEPNGLVHSVCAHTRHPATPGVTQSWWGVSRDLATLGDGRRKGHPL